MPRDLNTPEPPPTPKASTPIWALVIADMHARDHYGRAKYRTPLQANNGRDPLVDAYQEALDLCVYLRQEIEERTQEEYKLAKDAADSLAHDLAKHLRRYL